MIFISAPFFYFFSLFFILYWFVASKNHTSQNVLLLVGSYFFYAWWDWRFLLLLFSSSALTFYLAGKIPKASSEKKRTAILILALSIVLGALFFFKYYNFFVESFKQLLGSTSNTGLLDLILPLGISFYSFRMISYLLDVQNEAIEPEEDWKIYFTYIAFFPSLLSGPIDRAKGFIKQLKTERKFEYAAASDGMRLILWGLFKKLVISDNCAVVTAAIFGHYENFDSNTLLFGIFMFMFQGYTDFSGYSDMAVGISRLLGFKVINNFHFPFFALNIADFWQRWHISLTSWMTEYVFTPLSFLFRKQGKLGLILAIFINFFLVGLWHGANWAYVVFGLIQGCFFVPLVLLGRLREVVKLKKGTLLPSLGELLKMTVTFLLIGFACVLFKLEDTSAAFDYVTRVFSASVFQITPMISKNLPLLALMIIFIIVEWFGKDQEYGFAIVEKVKWRVARWSLYSVVLFTIGMFMRTNEATFIYFKF